MELKVVSHKKNEMEFELYGEGHLFSKLLVSKLLEDKGVEVAQYHVDHPLIGKPIFYVKTKKEDPMAALKKASKALKKDISSIAKA